MAALKAVVCVYSYIFHAVLALFLAAVGGLALGTTPQSLQLEMLPWTGTTLAYVVFFGALVGLVSILLAVTGRLRVLFFLWALVVTVMMIKGYFFSGYRFEPGNVRTAVYLVAGCLLALPGAWWQLMSRPADSRRHY